MAPDGLVPNKEVEIPFSLARSAAEARSPVVMRHVEAMRTPMSPDIRCRRPLLILGVQRIRNGVPLRRLPVRSSARPPARKIGSGRQCSLLCSELHRKRSGRPFVKPRDHLDHPSSFCQQLCV